MEEYRGDDEDGDLIPLPVKRRYDPRLGRWMTDDEWHVAIVEYKRKQAEGQGKSRAVIVGPPTRRKGK